MIISILTHAVVAVIGGVIGIFIYRNNTSLISDKADEIDAIWDKLGLTDKIDKLEEKVDELLSKK